MITIIDYGVGNINAFVNVYKRVDVPVKIAKSKEDLIGAQKLILPGVGHFDHAMAQLNNSGMRETLDKLVLIDKIPVIGICVGMQMLFDSSEESPGVAGLGVVAGEIKWLPEGVQRPQMQWNRLNIKNQDDLFAGLSENPWMYFVHSLSAVAKDQSVVVATCSYGSELLAALRLRNVFATQFHPEKSATEGLRILENFLNSCTVAATSKSV